MYTHVQICMLHLEIHPYICIHVMSYKQSNFHEYIYIYIYTHKQFKIDIQIRHAYRSYICIYASMDADHAHDHTCVYVLQAHKHTQIIHVHE
jgi:hypothetical protein